MESSRNQTDSFTSSQQRAVAARGNVLVMAGAGTGKTHTLVARCLDCIARESASLDEILVVTFTEAAATELRQRLRRALENSPNSEFCAEQLALFDTAHIGTLHSFCLKLVREHFYELGLDPQLAMLDEGEASLLANETLDEELQVHYAGENDLSEAVQRLIQIYGGGRDEKIRALVLRLHHYAQTRPNADGWLTRQMENFSSSKPKAWETWLAGIRDWRDDWLPALEHLRAENIKAAECLEILRKLPQTFSRPQAVTVLGEIQNASTVWPKGKKGVLERPLEKFFADAAFLNSLAPATDGHNPLAEDWNWAHDHMTALLRLTQSFSMRFANRKRADGVLDFHDLEQFALKLLWDSPTDKPTPNAGRWRKKLRFIFVDEYQDINAAQDRIISSLARDGADANRFLVGDVKQSIYRFRLADPKIFRNYDQNWHEKNGQTIPLTENFRSQENLLDFVNSFFEALMHEEIGGVNYNEEAKLKFGSRKGSSPDEPLPKKSNARSSGNEPRAELLLRLKPGRAEITVDDDLAELEESEKEARLLALRLCELKNSGHEIMADGRSRAVEWRDMVVLLRAPSGKAEVFAKQFECAGIPLVVESGGFYDNTEILDLLSLLQLLDNPLQDIPAIAVLRSPLVSLSLDELAAIRLAARSGHFWTALNRSLDSKAGLEEETRQKIGKFLERFARWRKLARQVSLSQCLESVLAETHYAEWLNSQPRGARRRANVERFLNLTEKFDQFQRQGLFRFLRFVEAQREIEAEPEVAPIAEENTVRLMSIHQSKGLEFPVVAIADLAKNFNLQDLRSEIILDEKLGLCPQVQPPQTGRRYPSLPYWLAQQHQRRELAGEELRLLYVAMTRARDTLILTGSVTEKNWTEVWHETGAVTSQNILSAKSYADWLGLWFAQQSGSNSAMQGALTHLRWRIVEDSELMGEAAIKSSEAKAKWPELDNTTLRKLRETLVWNYEFKAAMERKAKSSVTALRREAADETGDKAEQVFPARNFSQTTQRASHTKPSAADTGTAHHKFLQHVSLESVGELATLKTEAKRLEAEKILTPDETSGLNLKVIAGFWNSDAGQKIRGHLAAVKRELPFTVRFSPTELGEIIGKKPDTSLADEFIVVQGVADLAVLLPEEIWLVDFKTDEIHNGQLTEKIEVYKPQLKLYASALSKIYLRPVTNCWLHYLSVQETVRVKI